MREALRVAGLGGVVLLLFGLLSYAWTGSFDLWVVGNYGPSAEEGKPNKTPIYDVKLLTSYFDATPGDVALNSITFTVIESDTFENLIPTSGAPLAGPVSATASYPVSPDPGTDGYETLPGGVATHSPVQDADYFDIHYLGDFATRALAIGPTSGPRPPAERAACTDMPVSCSPLPSASCFYGKYG